MPILPTFDMDVAQGDCDALADLFLADDAREAPVGTAAVVSDAPVVSPGPAGVAARGVWVEGVIAGHLPVLASAWVTQYARHLADQHREAVAVLRVVGGQSLIDVVLPAGARGGECASAPGEDLRGAMVRVAGRCRRWVVRVDEASECDLLGLGLDRVTLLTGVDDAAVVASFQTLKSLALGGSVGTTGLRLAIMGADEGRAGAAELKLRQAAMKFLDRELARSVCIGKIGSSVSAPVFRGPAPASSELGGLVEMVRGVPAGEARVEVPAPVVMASPARVAPNGHAAAVNGEAAGPASRVGPLARTEPYLRELQLTPLGVECPYVKGVRFGADGQGRVHVVADAALGAGEAAQRLLTAGAWATAHQALLAAAAPVVRSAADPVLHLITSDARQVRGLLDTGIRLHLLTRVSVAGQTAEAVSPLN